jgi:hypothetical protein
MDLYYAQVFQQLQLTSTNSTVSILTQCLSEKPYSSSHLHVLFCTPRQHSTAVRDNLSQWTQDHKTERPTLFIVGPVAHERHSTTFNNQLTWESSQQPVTLDTITDINTVARKALTMSYLHRFTSCTRVTMAMATNVFALLITPH